MDTTPQDRDVERAIMLTGLMAGQPDGLSPMVSLLANDAESPEHKVFAIVCLTTQRDALQSFEATLTGWTGAGETAATRMFATHTLGLLSSPTALAVMEPLLDDPDKGVREAAMGVMLSFHPERVVDRIPAFWADSETSYAVRDQVVLGMPPHLIATHLDIFADAAVNKNLSPTARLKAISVLGQLGRASDISVLEQCIATAEKPELKEHAQGALALLRASTDTGTTATP